MNGWSKRKKKVEEIDANKTCRACRSGEKIQLRERQSEEREVPRGRKRERNIILRINPFSRRKRKTGKRGLNEITEGKEETGTF